MKYQRKLHDAFASKAVPARVRRAAFNVTAEADAEVASLLAKVKALSKALEDAVEMIVDVQCNAASDAKIDRTVQAGRALLEPQPESTKP